MGNIGACPCSPVTSVISAHALGREPGGGKAGALIVIWLVQRKLFSRERLIERRIGKGLCQDCGKRLPAGAHACPFCGFAQFVECGACRGSAHAYATHCAACGAALRAAETDAGAPEPA